MRTAKHQQETLCRQPEASFREAVIKGLTASRKYLEPKYFYDRKGDELFQQIMASPEYYLTRAEMEILSQQSGAIVAAIGKELQSFDIVELGAGDATKSEHLLRAALQQQRSSRYLPIDISPHMIRQLEQRLPSALPGLTVEGAAGEYFPMLEQLQQDYPGPRLVLFMGATIGNMTPREAQAFCGELHTFLNEGDYLLIGFDLKKDPQTILDAYNDAAGVTRDFNLNLLHRINRELGADFVPDRFIHYPVYNPSTGACESYLVSTCAQVVSLDEGTGPRFHFDAYEAIHTEISQKYSQEDIRRMAVASGFEQVRYFEDSERRFVDALWRVPSLKKVLTREA